MVEANPAAAQAEPTLGVFQNLGEIPDKVLNDAVREYEPTLEDIFFIIPSGDYQRILFQGQDLRDREETHL